MLMKVTHVPVIKGRLTRRAMTMPVIFTIDIKHKRSITIKSVPGKTGQMIFHAIHGHKLLQHQHTIHLKIDLQ